MFPNQRTIPLRTVVFLFIFKQNWLTDLLTLHNMIVLKLVAESFVFAWNALRSNLLRTTLSLLGVTIGIFAIITVFTIVDSLERSIKESFSFLGDQVIRVEKWPWLFQDDYPWWKYYKRPYPTENEFEFLAENVSQAEALSIFAKVNSVLLQYDNSSTSNVALTGVSYEYNEVFDVPVETGRYFSVQEMGMARNIAIIGYEIKESLFPNINPIGKEIKIKGLKFTVIGVMEEQGESFVGDASLDKVCLIPYRSFLKLYTSNSQSGIGSTIALKAMPDDPSASRLEGEVTGLMRSRRGLRPKQEENFAVNRSEAFADMLGNLFNIIGLAGGVIGSFSILVGGFGIANIMFVSVKERTSIIGIQKSLGAKNYFILLQFLFEAVFLSLIGGLAGLVLVYLTTFIPLGSLVLSLTVRNVVLGIFVSGIIGIISGVLPAITASRLDPVEAIRS